MPARERLARKIEADIIAASYRPARIWPAPETLRSIIARHLRLSRDTEILDFLMDSRRVTTYPANAIITDYIKTRRQALAAMRKAKGER